MAVNVLLFQLSFLLILSYGNGNPPINVQNGQMKITDLINKFSNRFYSEVTNIKEIKGKDAIMSALSAQIALSILSLGAGGETLTQLNTALNLPSSNYTKSALPAEIANLKALEGIILSIANKIYVKKNYTLNPVVQKEAAELFLSEIENIDFGNAKYAANTINSWVEQKTNSKIKNIVTEQMITDALRLIIINAIYFKAKWENPFDANRTTKKDFFIDSVTKAQADMMNKRSHYPYLAMKQLDAQCVELYYEKRNFSMIIVLPKKIDGLSVLEKKLQNVNLKATIFDRLKDTDLFLSMPKFKIESQMDLNGVIINLGAKLIFDVNNANLTSLLTQQEQLFVSYVIQKAFIEVNEEGTEAAAVTVIGLVGSGRPSDPSVTVNANHPFLFFIKSKTGNIIFSGRFTGSNLSNKITTKPSPTPRKY